MNIKIPIHFHELLQKHVKYKFEIGSGMYGVKNENSDTDILCIYDDSWLLKKPYEISLPNFHQFQYDDNENNIDYIYTSEVQFWKNQQSGDSTINSEVVMFTNLVFDKDKLNYVRTQKVIKAYIGFINRDLKQYSKNKTDKKLYHILRGLEIVDCLLNNKLPTLQTIQNVYKMNLSSIKIDNLVKMEKELRKLCNTLYENKVLENYYIPKHYSSLYDLLLQSNNTRQFTYE